MKHVIERKLNTENSKQIKKLVEILLKQYLGTKKVFRSLKVYLNYSVDF